MSGVGADTPRSGFGDVAPHTIDIAGRRFTIRRAERADLRALVGLLRDDVLGTAREQADDDLSAYERAFDLITADPHQLLVSVEENGAATVGRPTEDGGAAEVLPVAADEPTEPPIVGTLQLSLIPGLSRAGTTRLQIEAVRIGEPAQGIGLGGAVFAWAHERGRAAGARLAQLTTDKSRADAQRFYARLGYTASHEGLKLDLSPDA
ncbi:GNAT family N-acetyltransferase [Brevibacterium metallidurans]|uniref:GNAT family N-acetyltransferase n=1 Tax=Brevibacterium metallidurans TaxID=1482676 RepID=A0ABN0SLZ6_9MICO